MRILHLLASPFWSGPAEIVARLALAQRALGHEVTVAVDRKRTKTPAEELAVPRLQEHELLDEGGLELSVKSGVRAVFADIRALRTRKVDVAHAHFSHDHYLARFGRPPGSVLIRSLHAPRSLRWSLPAADGYTAPTEPMVKLLAPRKAMRLSPIVPPGFTQATDLRALRQRLGLEGSPLVGMISTFQPSRRHALGISAFAKLRAQRAQARLLLIGDGALEPELRAQVKAAGLAGHVVFAGYQTGEAFIERLQALDVVWILGLGNDWSGRAAAQARACGVRVVAVDEGALSSCADAVVAIDEAAIVEATLRGDRREVPLPSGEAVAREVLEFYLRCGAPR